MDKNLVAISLGTCMAELATIPICTIKTNYQTNMHNKTIPSTIAHIYKTRGWVGFINASHIAVISQIVSTSVKYTSYEKIKNIRGSDNTIGNNIVNGCVAGIIASFFSHPLDTLKIHQQSDIAISPRLNSDGLRLLYRGFSKTIIKNILMTGSILPLYDMYKSFTGIPLVSAMLTTTTVTLFLQPIDFLRVRHIAGKSLFLGYDIRNYYRGLSINYIRVMPHFAITMTVTEYIKKLLDI